MRRPIAQVKSLDVRRAAASAVSSLARPRLALTGSGLRYGLAIASDLVALLTALALEAPLQGSAFALFLAAVSFSAWCGGLGPGLLATAIGALAIDYFFELPHHTLVISSLITAVDLVGFVVVALLISSMNAYLLAARRRAEAAEGAQRFLSEASVVLASSLDYETTLQRVARLAVAHLADWCLVDLVADEGQVRRVAMAHADTAKEDEVRQLERYPPHPDRPHPLWEVLRTGRSYLVADVPDARLGDGTWDAEHLAMLHRLGLRSYILVPLVTHARTLGAMAFIRASADRRYGPEDLALAEELARRCVLAVDNARLYEAERRARAAAEQLAAERAAILAQIGDGVVVADRDGRVTFMNAVARDRFGLAGWEPGAEGAGVASVLNSTGALYHTEDLPLTRAALGGEAVTAQELRIRRRDGMELIAEGVATPVPAVDGTRIGAVLTLHDVTARRELERQKEEFFANASHDLRTPVATIKGAIEVVLQNEPPGIPEPLRRMLVIIDHEAERMATLVDDLLELTRLEAGRVQLRLARCDLRTIARGAACAIEPLTHRLGQRVVVEVPKRPVPALVDGERLERALLNLLANAHKYAYEGTTICLSLQRRAGEAVLAVADEGPGITPEDQARVFERFYRPTTAATRRNNGSGLGLPIAKAMVELHGGRIWVESGPGKGATFLIALPVGGPMAPGNGARR